MKKRIISMLLAVTMLVSLLPVSAWADTQPWEAAEYTYDPALVAEIQKICDEEKLDYSAVDVLDALRQSGVIDKKGDLKLSGTFTVVENNAETKMSRETLAATAAQRETGAELTLDGVAMTWGDVAKLINMMDALAAIQTCLESKES